MSHIMLSAFLKLADSLDKISSHFTGSSSLQLRIHLCLLMKTRKSVSPKKEEKYSILFFLCEHVSKMRTHRRCKYKFYTIWFSDLKSISPYITRLKTIVSLHNCWLRGWQKNYVRINVNWYFSIKKIIKWSAI